MKQKVQEEKLQEEELRDFAFAFAEAQPAYLGKPAFPPQSYAQRLNNDVVVILADGRKMVVDPTKPIRAVVSQPSAPAVTQEQVEQLLARIAELEARVGIIDDPSAPRITPETIEDGVNTDEAKLAGQALQVRKTTKKD